VSRAAGVVRVAVLSAVAVLTAGPFLWMLSTSLKPGADVFASPPKWIPHPATLHAYQTALIQLPFGHYLFNSVVVTVITVLSNVLFATAAAYAFAKLRFPGRDAIFFALLLTLMIPYQVNLIPLYRMMVSLHNISPHLGVDTYFGLIAPNAVGVFGIFLMRQYLASIPDSVIEAARLARPGIAAMAIFVFLNSWNDFLWPLLVTDSDNMRTLPVGLALLQRRNTVVWPETMAGAVITIVPMLAVFAVLQRRFVEGLTAGAVRD
jgi:ABC-type glycerol-3-phosphate transport system permease component